MNDFQDRITYKGDIKEVLTTAALDFNLGNYSLHKVIKTGYEDFNIILETDRGKYFVKMFASFRSDKDCKRYVDMMLTVLEAGVNHPKLYKTHQGFLYKRTFESTSIRLTIMEFIDGKSLYESKEQISLEEAKYLVHQATLINKIKLDVPFVYDGWAIVNFLKEWKNNKNFFPTSDVETIDPLAKQFSSLNIKSLPVAFVHGDIIRTNVIKNKKGKLFILDFSVANNYPRIQELAVLLCNLLYNDKDPNEFITYYNLALEEYQRCIKLEKIEVETLPLYLKAAHAMHIIGAGTEKYKKGNKSKENDYWLEQGRKGLKDMNRIFK